MEGQRLETLPFPYRSHSQTPSALSALLLPVKSWKETLNTQLQFILMGPKTSYYLKLVVESSTSYAVLQTNSSLIHLLKPFVSTMAAER